jgi:Predicted AAA-ATPase/PD-(D/E)XK nuclease superfamily
LVVICPWATLNQITKELAFASTLEYNLIMRLPTGVQDFATIREEEMVYIDKTMYMQPFLEHGRYFFARPRRFGKSLLLSTLHAAYSGRKNLFQGLWLENHFDFAARKVIRLDFSKLDSLGRSLEQSILLDLQQTAVSYGLKLEQNSAKAAFEELIIKCSTERKCVVLIDEYDKPITDHILDHHKRLEHQATLKSIYGVLKPMDAHLHLVFITGVSKIGKLSLFSDLNNLSDISLDEEFALLCGYTRADIEQHFTAWLEPIQHKFALSKAQLFEVMTFWYNGYSWDGFNKLYCPFSFLVFLKRRVFHSFWFDTGSPSLIVNLFRARKIDVFALEQIFVAGEALSVLNVEALDTYSLMFQTGYLTIQNIEATTAGTKYTLSYPNNEVRIAFSTSLLEDYSQTPSAEFSGFSLAIQDALLEKNWEGLFKTCNRVLAGIPYEVFPAKEAYMHSLMHLLLTSSGFSTQTQVQTSLGRMDTLVKTPNHAIILEFKLGGSAKDALAQIDEKQYPASLEGDVVKLGVVFDLEQKKILEWAASS